MQRIYYEYKDQQSRAIQITQNSILKLENYKQARDELHDECDGFYIIIKGEAQIRNAFDNQKLQTLRVGDHFGFSKFLKMQGFTYFGDIHATTSISEEALKLEKKRTDKYSRNQ